MIIIALVGFEKAIISVRNAEGQIEKLTIDKSGGGTIESSITGISPEQTTVYASNVPIYVSAKGVGEVQATLNVFDLYKNGVYEKILGILVILMVLQKLVKTQNLLMFQLCLSQVIQKVKMYS